MPGERKPPVLLHLGCGTTRLDGWVNCDFVATEFADQVFDAQVAPWPFEDNSVREIYASHMLEHLADFNTFFKEAWRVLEPNGAVGIRVPYGGHSLAWSDPTHLRPWYAGSFCYLQPGYGEAVRNPQEFEWSAPFGVAKIDLRIAGKFAPIMRWKLGRKLLLPWIDNIQNGVEEVFAWLYAIKSPEAVALFKQGNPNANAVPVTFCMYRHQFQGHATLPEGDTLGLTHFNFDLTLDQNVPDTTK